MALIPEKFQHQPLLDSSRMIRIFELLPSALKWSGIQTSLRAVPLDDVPIYEALSYTWGTERPVHRICCNGQAFAIRPNLFQALRRLRYRTKPRVLWIDAICIDQDNTDEKNLQIPLMRRIYMSASQVLVWLGEEANDSPKAMALMRKLSKIDEDDFGGNSRALLFREPSGSIFMPAFLRNWLEEFLDDDSDLYEDSDSDSDMDLNSVLSALPTAAGNLTTMTAKSVLGVFAPEDSQSGTSSDDDSSIIGVNRLSDVYLPPRGYRAWKALRELINRPWFSRIWVIQEVVVAKKALVICGKDVLPWKVIKATAEAMMAASFPDEAGGRSWMNIVAISGAVRVHNGERQTKTVVESRDFGIHVRDEEDTDAVESHKLLNLLMGTLHTDATDPRDKIYGLFGLVESLTVSMPPIKVDYRVPVEELYRDVARFLIMEDKNLVLLQMHGSKRKLHGLPSWVPDWSVPKNFASTVVSLEDLDRPRDIDIDVRAVIRETDNPDELVLGAKRLDVVGRTGMAVEQYSGKGDLMRSMEVALKDWVAMVSSIPEIKSRAPGEAKAEPFWRVIIANMDGQKDEPPKEYGAYFATWLTQMGLRADLLGVPEVEDGSVNPRDVERYISDAVWTCSDRRLCVSVTGSLCLAPANAQEGDALVFFLGGQTPFVVRENGPFYTFVGPCYIHGFNPVDTLNDMTEDIVLR
jgi:hypothetical protein